MKKSKSITVKTKKPEDSIVQSKITLDLVKELKEMKNVEDLGTSVLRSAHQFYLVIQSILKERYSFDDKELKELNKEVAHAVEGLGYFEQNGLHPLSAHSIDELVDVTVNHYTTLKAARSGIELPVDKTAAKLLMGNKK
jgi:hypothetical protein